jgi:D-xylose transport system substrate-binding protein
VGKLRYWALVPVLALTLSACGSDDGDSGDGGGSGEGLTVGVSWNNFNEPRWAKADEPAIKDTLEAAGATYISTDAGSSESQQITDVENLISQGADVLIILAQDGTAIKPAVQSALDQGIPVIAYDRLIEDEGAFYLTFDNVEVGRMQAQAIYDVVPEGNYVFIKGNEADANADFLFGGQMEVLLAETGCDALATKANPDTCPIANVGESYTDNWATEVAQRNMEQFLTANNNNVDAVVSSNDGMAIGVIAALQAQGLAGQVPVSGQDGDTANLNKVALGEQTVDVWKNAFALGTAAADIAIQLGNGTALEDVSVELPDEYDTSKPADGPDAAPFETPGGVTLESLVLTPIPVTQDNLSEPIDAGWVTTDEVCQGVPAGTVDVCG